MIGKVAHHFGGGDQLAHGFTFGTQGNQNRPRSHGRCTARHHLGDKVAHNDGRQVIALEQLFNDFFGVHDAP